MRDLTTWQELILDEMTRNKETWADLQFTTLNEEQLIARFDDSYGLEEGKPFTLWTTNRVYFPASYDGAEFVGSVPRNPCPEVTQHIGG